MKESYDEGLANHIGPESWVGNGNIISEALTGERRLGIEPRKRCKSER